MRNITPEDLAPGTIHDSANFGKFEILEYKNKSNIKIKFLNTGTIRTARSHTIRNSSVKDNYAPNVYGIGYVGEGEYSANDTDFYSRWVLMLSRCYSERYQKNFPTYIGCTVCKEWHNFQNFAKWMSDKDYKDKQLDKDILIKGNREYSPLACMFVTQKENATEAIAKHYKFVSPSGDVVEIYNMKKFCLENNLNPKGMSKVNTGYRNKYKGWSKYVE
jgi:hypothetical protein